MSTLTNKQRDALSAESFGDPNGKRFPILDQSDIDAAAHLIGRAKGIDQDAVKGRIIAIARRLKLSPPAAWVTQDTAQMSALFALDGEEADYVIRTGPIFEVGDYEDQQMTVTPDDLLGIVADFSKPVPLELEHYDSNNKPNILSGKIGECFEVSVSEDGRQLIGRNRIPRWLDTLHKDTPIKVSAALRYVDKGLERVGLVRVPQVPNAAIFSAYATFAGARHSTQDMADMQTMHDISAKQGAVCSADNCPTGAPGTGVGVGAGSAQYSQSTKQEKKKMTLKERWNTFINGKTPEQLAAVTEEELTAQFAKVDPPAPPAVPAPVLPQQSAEIEALLKKVAEFAADKRTAQATQKVEALIHSGKLYPSERAYALATFTRAMEDDETAPALATFSGSDGKAVQATRVQVLEAQYQARPAHNLTKEAVAVFSLPANDGADAQKEAETRKKKLLESTDGGRKAVAYNNGK